MKATKKNQKKKSQVSNWLGFTYMCIMIILISGNNHPHPILNFHMLLTTVAWVVVFGERLWPGSQWQKE